MSVGSDGGLAAARPEKKSTVLGLYERRRRRRPASPAAGRRGLSYVWRRRAGAANAPPPVPHGSGGGGCGCGGGLPTTTAGVWGGRDSAAETGELTGRGAGGVGRGGCRYGCHRSPMEERNRFQARAAARMVDTQGVGVRAVRSSGGTPSRRWHLSERPPSGRPSAHGAAPAPPDGDGAATALPGVPRTPRSQSQLAPPPFFLFSSSTPPAVDSAWLTTADDEDEVPPAAADGRCHSAVGSLPLCSVNDGVRPLAGAANRLEAWHRLVAE